MSLIFAFVIHSLAFQIQQEAYFLKIQNHSFHVELALTPQQWQRGLMYRDKLGKNQGMLFVGTQDRPRSFWMKNTYIPLDIIFLDKDLKIVSVAFQTTPESTKAIESEGPARHVFEVNAGMAKKLQLKPGMQFQASFDISSLKSEMP